MPPTRPGRRRTRVVACSLAAGVLALAPVSRAQPVEVTGRDFAGVRFANPTSPGPVAFHAGTIRTWKQGDVHRLFFTDRVRVTLGDRVFIAKSGSAFLEIIDDPDNPRVQAYVYLEGVGDPREPAGSSAASALPIRGVFSLAAPVAVTADAIADGPPKDSAALATLAAAEASLARSLRQQLGQPDPAATLPPLPTFTPSGRASARPPSARQPSPEGPPKPTLHPPAPDALTRRTDVAPPPPPPPPPPEREPATPAQPPRTAVNTPPAPAKPATRTEQPGAPDRQPGKAPPTRVEPADSIFRGTGVVSVAPGSFSIISGAEESAISAWGGVTVQYSDLASNRSLQITAERAVVFLDPGSVADLAGMSAEGVRGIYLEGDVTATDGTYTVRGPHVYYDLRENKAVMLDAVFWMYDEQRQLPLYVRARTIRQTAADTFRGEDAQFTTSAFFDPELSLGASSITITRRVVAPAPSALGTPSGEGPRNAVWVDARDVTAKVLGVPIFYWPRYSGDPEQRVLTDVRLENRSGSGAAILTTLNAYALLGLDGAKSLSLDVLADFYFERGPGVGLRAEWADPRQNGSAFAYTVPMDRGTDVLKPGTEINRDDEFRGLVLAEQRWRLDQEWTVFGELSHFSDENVIDAFFENLGETRREFTNRLAARRLSGNTMLLGEVKGTFQDFISNEYLLQSPGYSVARHPEFTYLRVADDLLPETAPGALTYFSEYRAGRLSLAFDEVSASEHGMTFTRLSQAAFGITPDQSIADSLRAQGYTETGVTRLDTRHEAAAQFSLGPIRLNPFVVARATFWDDSFEEFSPDEDDPTRIWGAAGVRASTTISRVYDDANSRLFDIHRLRHVVEPSLTVWAADTTIDSRDLPVYDQDVEALADGAMIRVGVNQILQTQRGGPGQWHSTDLVSLSTDLVLSSDDAPRKGPYGRFLDFRPEVSSPGDYFVADLAVRLTDATSLTATNIYDFDLRQQAASGIGFMIRQQPNFSASVDLRYLNPQDATYLTGGVRYELTEKYSTSFGAAYDIDEAQFQWVALELRRKFQSTLLGVVLTTNEITGETGISVIIRPYGVTGEVGVGSMGARVGAR